MFGLAIRRKIAILIAFVVIALAAVACSAEQEPQDPARDADCDTSDPECAKQIGAALGAQYDAKVKDILLGNEAFAEMAAGRELGCDFWIDITHVWQPLHGQRVAWVTIVLAEPVSYGGEVPVIVRDPCSGHAGADEELDPDDPCLHEPNEYGTRYVTISDVRQMHATIEPDRGKLVDIFFTDTPPDIVNDTIDYFKGSKINEAQCGTPGDAGGSRAEP